MMNTLINANDLIKFLFSCSTENCNDELVTLSMEDDYKSALTNQINHASPELLQEYIAWTNQNYSDTGPAAISKLIDYLMPYSMGEFCEYFEIEPNYITVTQFWIVEDDLALFLMNRSENVERILGLFIWGTNESTSITLDAFNNQTKQMDF